MADKKIEVLDEKAAEVPVAELPELSGALLGLTTYPSDHPIIAEMEKKAKRYRAEAKKIQKFVLEQEAVLARGHCALIGSPVASTPDRPHKSHLFDHLMNIADSYNNRAKRVEWELEFMRVYKASYDEFACSVAERTKFELEKYDKLANGAK